MRNTRQWSTAIQKQLERHWEETLPLSPNDFCDVELGIYLLSEIAPDVPARALWIMLRGYEFPALEAAKWTSESWQMLGTARHYLLHFWRKYPWEQALTLYRQVLEMYRAFDIDDDLTQIVKREVSIAPQRIQVYDTTLRTPAPYEKRTAHYGDAQRYLFHSYGLQREADFADLAALPPQGHNLNSKTTRAPIVVNWTELKETAQWMDQQLAGSASWESRFNGVRLEVFQNDDTLARAEVLTLEKVSNFVGMVSSGKSTLMTIMAAWCARNGHRVTLVVGDVITALNLAKTFAELGLEATPILGRSNRDRHANRLHRLMAADHPDESPLGYKHVGFKWLSEFCFVDAMADQKQALDRDQLPCQQMYRAEDAGKRTKYHICPAYGICPRHIAQRELVTSNIWIATPASLIYTRVDAPINRENLTFAELVYRCCDLVIVDEADQVQAQLDMMFSPSQTLVSADRIQEGWLDTLAKRVPMELLRTGRGITEQTSVDAWTTANSYAQLAANKVYKLLHSQPDLRQWLREEGYFAVWMLMDSIAHTLRKNVTDEIQTGQQMAMPIAFETFINDPLANEVGGPANAAEANPLALLAHTALSMSDHKAVQSQVIAWIRQRPEFDAELDQDQAADAALRLMFALLVGVLQSQLNHIIHTWHVVERTLNLADESSLLFHRPPEDFQAVVPPAPMGNVLAFQYLQLSDRSQGDLRFFRCMGLGRWILLKFPELFAADGVSGPHVMLLSGTSWAAESPGFHIQLPVAGILRAPDEEIAAVSKSSFEFHRFAYRDAVNFAPVIVSGLQGEARMAALEEILTQLAAPRGRNEERPSQLEEMRDSLPEGRRRILLVVGSYREAERVREHLTNLRKDWKGQVLNLKPDDDNFETLWDSGRDLYRGLVYQFAETDAWLLTAPLLAIERGHNILSDGAGDGRKMAAIGTAYFLVRPHPHPHDLSFAIQSINRWGWQAQRFDEQPLPWEEAGEAFHQQAYRQWRRLINMDVIYSYMSDKDRRAIIWNQLVTIWQVIGRLIRGGVEAQVIFCDGAFAANAAKRLPEKDTAQTSLLVGMQQVLKPYFDPSSDLPKRDRVLANALYGPFYRALTDIRLS